MTAPDLTPTEAATVARFDAANAVTEASVERDAIVAWLRLAAQNPLGPMAVLTTVAALIEAGEHHA